MPRVLPDVVIVASSGDHSRTPKYARRWIELTMVELRPTSGDGGASGRDSPIDFASVSRLRVPPFG